MSDINRYIETGLIEPEELHALMNEREDAPALKLVDATFVLPGSTENPYANYLKQRIDGAVFFDIDEIADKTSPMPHMLSSASEFEIAMSRLGITNDDLIVVYGQAGITMGPARVWWTFRVFGHDRVCVLNGGMPAWLKAGFGLVTEQPIAPAPSAYSAEFREELVRSLDDVRQACQSGESLILDARPAERFDGSAPEPRPGMRSGHIPGSRNIPCMTLIDQKTGKLKTKEELQAVFDTAGFKDGKPVITSCGSGVTACVIALALYHTGYENAAVYDGSWCEWGQEDAPTEVSTS